MHGRKRESEVAQSCPTLSDPMTAARPPLHLYLYTGFHVKTSQGIISTLDLPRSSAITSFLHLSPRFLNSSSNLPRSASFTLKPLFTSISLQLQNEKPLSKGYQCSFDRNSYIAGYPRRINSEEKNTDINAKLSLYILAIFDRCKPDMQIEFLWCIATFKVFFNRIYNLEI